MPRLSVSAGQKIPTENCQQDEPDGGTRVQTAAQEETQENVKQTGGGVMAGGNKSSNFSREHAPDTSDVC